MTEAGLSESQLALHASDALGRADGPVVLAYAWSGNWNQAHSLQVGNQNLTVHQCDSPLAVREALLESGGRTSILLITFAESQLAQDVLARLFRHRVLHVDRWQMMAQACGAKEIDPRLFDIPWVVDTLLEAGNARTPGSLTALTYDDAVATCLHRVLGIESDSLDLVILTESMEAGALNWSELPVEQRDVYHSYLVNKLGTVVEGILGAVNAGYAQAIPSIGLVCEILFAKDGANQTALRDARVRLENLLDGYRLSENDGRRWAKIATRSVARREENARQPIFLGANDLLTKLGATDYVGESSVLPESLDNRLDKLAKAVVSFLRNPAGLPEVETAANFVLKHELTPREHPGPESAKMILRLCRAQAASTSKNATSLVGEDYLRHGAWEDQARRSLRVLRPESLARAAVKLFERLQTRRAEADLSFAEYVVKHAANGEHPTGLLPVEAALSEIVAPLAACGPTVMIVLDGMSWDVFLSIAHDMEHTGWSAWKRENGPRSLLATTPSVTEFSRASLLAGHLMRGTSAHEKKAFQANQSLKGITRNGKIPALLHKAEIQSTNQLSTQAAELLVDPQQRVIGLVINAIDDALAKSEQVRIDWSIEHIPLLAAILGLARSAGRSVILTSDHGHVLENGTQYRKTGDAERWRSGNGEPDEGEIRISGPRVEALLGSTMIAPWKESVRYGMKKNGYHGGITQQEMLVPFGIWTAGDAPGPDFVPALHTPPAWWTADASALPDTRIEAVVTNNKKSHPDLFTQAKKEDWIKPLLQSEVLQRQRERVGRTALSDDRLLALLTRVDALGGRASTEQLAAAIEQPLLRMRGVLSILQRMLNVDGFPVVAIEPGTNIVMLDKSMLRTQFEL